MAFTIGEMNMRVASDEEVEEKAAQVLSFQFGQQAELADFMDLLQEMPHIYAQVMARLSTLARVEKARVAWRKRKTASARSKAAYRLKSEVLRIAETLYPGPRRLKAATHRTLLKLNHTQRRALMMGNAIALMPRTENPQSYTNPRISQLWAWGAFALHNGVVRLLPRDEDPDDEDERPHDPSASSAVD